MDRLSFRSQTDAAGFTSLSNLVLLDTKLSDGAKVTYLLLLHYARQAASCFPGQDTLAAKRGVSDRSVRAHLAELVTRGLVTVERRGKGKTNLYWLESLEEVYRQESSDQAHDRKFSSGSDRKKTSEALRLEEYTQNQESETLNVGKRSSKKTLIPDIERAIHLTNDNNSARRFTQLHDIAQRHGCLGVWDEAIESLKRRMAKKDDPLRSKGAYFCKTLTDLLLERGIAVPVGGQAEREDVRAQIAASLGLSEAQNGRK